MEHPSTNNEYPIHETPKGKRIEVRPDGVYGLWIINPHGTNLPKNLKNAKFTTAEEGSKAVTKWIDSIEVKEQEAVKKNTQAEIDKQVEEEVTKAIKEAAKAEEAVVAKVPNKKAVKLNK